MRTCIFCDGSEVPAEREDLGAGPEWRCALCGTWQHEVIDLLPLQQAGISSDM